MNSKKQNLYIDRLIRTRRKSVSITITPKSEIIVRAPLGLSDEIIFDIVLKKHAWIKDKIGQISNIKEKAFAPGESFPFLGSSYILQSTLNRNNIGVNGDRLEIPESFLHDAEKKLFEWYKNQALKILSERCAMVSEKTGIRPSSLKITGAKKRWGSCGHRGNINLSWRLAMCPVEVIDYVIVHELAHIKVRNHSKLFWDKVEELLPDYREQELWLKKNSRSMNF
ncbi:M48 family metallopeptidase [Desulforegula conservatrix]|uniref:M48 family metallopeptidase n=1 Tax=Desulforegula conservatrix TaxID=153026 RepID=UPI00041F4BE6|nr:SprT family zinc-dependent metalloprotease [Desulforegula conservatrix]